MTIFAQEKFRAWALNLPILLVFACAWLSDSYPTYSYAALGGAFVAVLAEIGGIYAWAQKKRRAAEATAVSDTHTIPEDKRQLAALHQHLVLVRKNHHLRKTFHNQMLASRSSTWAVAQALESAVDREQLAFWTSSPAAFRSGQLPDELKSWKLIDHGPSAFKIEAGLFEIEFYQGDAHVRVLDSSRVTIEGAHADPSSAASLPLATRAMH